MLNNKAETVSGIKYSLPTVVLLQETGIGTSEVAARTCYDSFDSSENECVSMFDDYFNQDQSNRTNKQTYTILDSLNNISHSNLLDNLSWTYFHHSILEHINLTYLVRGTSRAVLQEHARHRIQGISVRSTRYTGSGVLNAFVSSMNYQDGLPFFKDTIYKLDMFVTSDRRYNDIEAESIYNKLKYQQRLLGTTECVKLMVAKSSIPLVQTIHYGPDLFNALQNGKAKRNALDPFKHIVSDNWKVDMVVTFNLRSLKNYFQLRNSGSAFFQIQWLSIEMIKATPQKYLDLIIKRKKEVTDEIK